MAKSGSSFLRIADPPGTLAHTSPAHRAFIRQLDAGQADIQIECRPRAIRKAGGRNRWVIFRAYLTVPSAKEVELQPYSGVKGVKLYVPSQW
jgi:hypothetical protein